MVRKITKLAATTSLAVTFLLVSPPAAQAMELSSSDFANGARLPLAQVHTRCGGQNRSPALRWTGAPATTRSFALTLFDPDAGGGAGFWHWLMFDIPASTTELPEGAGGLPKGVEQADNGFGDSGYGGACPPPGSGTHHYQFTVYALGTPQIPLGANTDAATLQAYLKDHSLASASLVATYSR
jgi:Raf kinase inhibitor-like YbhB/YbcL family protein